MSLWFDVAKKHILNIIAYAISQYYEASSLK
jgi:hypothetical protein